MSAQTTPITWIIVADRARALFFRTSKADLTDLQLHQTIENPDGRLKPQEVNSDKPGRFFGDDGAHVSGDPQTDVRHQSANDHAKTIVEALEQGRNHQEFDRVVLVAPSLLLGALRNKCGSPLAKCITNEFDLELANLPDHDIQARLRTKLAETSKK